MHVALKEKIALHIIRAAAIPLHQDKYRRHVES